MYKLRKRILEFTLLAVIFSYITILFFKDVIFSNDIMVFRDLGRFFYPPREYAFRLLRQGIIPFWNPYIYCGNPLIASHQATVFYPVSLVYMLGNFEKAFNNFIFIHFILAGLFMYIFLIDQRISKSSSFMGSLMFAFSGYMIATVNVLTFFTSGIWVPLVLWAFFRAIERKDRLYIIVSAISLVFMFLAGEPMIFYMTSLVLILFGLKKLKILAFIAALFLLLSAFQLLPVLELLIASDRMKMNYDIATKWSMAPYNFFNLIFPCVTEIESFFKGYWDKQSWLLDYYLGIFPLIILPIAIFLVKDRKKPVILSILAVSIILALGKYTPVYHVLFKYFPGFSFFRYPVKYFYLTMFSLSWLCAIGYDFYENNARTNPRLIRFVKALLYLALILSFALLLIDLFFKDWVQLIHKSFFLNLEKLSKKDSTSLPFIALSFFTIRRSFVFFLIFVLILFVGTKRRVRIKAVSFSIIGFILIDLYSASYDININYSCDVRKFKNPSSNIEFLMKDKSLFRTISSPANIYLMFNPQKEICKDKDALEVGKDRLYPNRMMEYGIYDVGGYEAVSRKRILDMISFLMFGIKGPKDTRLLDLLNVKYIASPKVLDVEGWRLVKKSDIANLYENMDVLPRAFLSERAVVLKGREAIFGKFQDKSWDPRQEVILEEEPSVKTKDHPSASLGTGRPKTIDQERVEIVKYSPNEVTIRATVSSSKFLVLSDSYYPGWKVYIDGRQDKIYAADYILRAVYLDTGAHTVKFVFDPFSFKLGLGISITTLIIIIFYIVYKKK